MKAAATPHAGGGFVRRVTSHTLRVSRPGDLERSPRGRVRRRGAHRGEAIGQAVPSPCRARDKRMSSPVLTIEERQNIETGPWFSKLSLPLRQAILSRARVRRLVRRGKSLMRGGYRHLAQLQLQPPH